MLDINLKGPFNVTRRIAPYMITAKSGVIISNSSMEGSTPREIAERSAGNLLPVPWVEVEDVAQLVAFLASDKARYVTGSQVVLDAGLLSV